MVMVNSLLLYRRDCDSLDVSRKKLKDLLAFRTSIAQALYAGKGYVKEEEEAAFN